MWPRSSGASPSRTTFDSRMLFQKRGVARSCDGCCATWLRENLPSATRQPWKTSPCWRSSKKKRNRGPIHATQDWFHRTRHHGQANGEEPYQSRVYAGRSQSQSCQGGRTRKGRRVRRDVAEGSCVVCRHHHHDVAE